MDPLSAASKIAGSGLEVQSTRLRIVSENIANARSTGDTPGADPYRRKTVTFGSELDRVSGVERVTVKKLGVDRGLNAAAFTFQFLVDGCDFREVLSNQFRIAISKDGFPQGILTPEQLMFYSAGGLPEDDPFLKKEEAN